MGAWRWRLMGKGALFALLVALAPIPGAAQTSVPTFLDGKAYQSLGEEYRTYYVLGLYDMMQRMSAAISETKTRDTLSRYNQCISGMSAGELRAFVDSYLVSDPGAAQYAMATNFFAALGLRCP